MGITVNGVTIPENVANALNINGINITNVVANGISVWNQSLINITKWSGSTLAIAPTTTQQYGIEASNNLIRSRQGSNTNIGAWITTNNDGTFTGTSSSAAVGDLQTIVGSGSVLTFGGTGSIVFDPSTKQFTGTAYDLLYNGLGNKYETSSGLVRVNRILTSATLGNWISLT